MNIIYMVVAGLASGVLGGMGMGGGTILIPILVLLLGIDQHLAQSINLISFVPMAAISLGFHIKHKLVDFKSVLLIAAPGAAAGALGAYLVRGLSGALLKRLFGVFLAALGVLQFVVIAVKRTKARRQKKVLKYM